MRPAAVLAAVCVLAVSTLPVQFVAAQQSDYLIVPGQRVGRWELGKPIDGYGFPEQRGHWEGQAEGKPYHDGYSMTIQPDRLQLWAFTCKSDSMVFELRVIRTVDEAGQATEATKYKTVDGIQVGLDEGEVQKILGRPSGTSQWTERHGRFEVLVRAFDYPGLRVLINRSDLKVFAVGALKEGGWPACRQAVLGPPPAAQPVPATSPAPRRPAGQHYFAGPLAQ